ncbi:glycoside hydrolase family 16 protein [Paxillus involutus ATCC 200175]|uniref:Glycoside hydrolase family 16 protein n=1 Tax=Paxillus involutus ATCC 200175 TaxID=664439 RepID=A0A0C9U8N7_PAXIN|nr:glycoside hydrolase family 16 protein [Paxillus involutus ATCC 200175]
MSALLFSGILFILLSRAVAYNIIREYAGSTFFDRWDFYGGLDNLTLGNATWVSKSEAMNQSLAYVNSEGHVIIKVDNTTNVPSGQNRNSVRITTQDVYDLGSLWIIDLNHIPFGCSVWPAFWSYGPNWPQDGEIDIIEAINMMTNNQMAIHTTPGCTHTGNVDQLGVTGSTTDCSLAPGCVISETSPNSYSSSFSEAGGGVWATQFDSSGIFIWFWSRPDVPPSISQANSTSSMDISQWGTPHASYFSATCNISQFFTPQNLVLDITLCGDWAGVPSIYQSTCANAGPTGLCYNDSVVGPGSPGFDDAYFDISYIRTYTSASVVPSTTPTSTSLSTSTLSPSKAQLSGSIRSKNDFTIALLAMLALVVDPILPLRSRL